MSKSIRELSPNELSELYDNFVFCRDRICAGNSCLTITEFYRKYGIGAAQK